MEDEIQQLVEGLRDRDHQKAYQCFKKLESISERSDAVYSFFDTFAEMLDDANSYVRTRGILLIAAHARWDTECKIDEMIDRYLGHVMDEKPITARQCVKALPCIARYKPDLTGDIYRALRKANPRIYKSSMQPLFRRDIQEALKAMAVAETKPVDSGIFDRE